MQQFPHSEIHSTASKVVQRNAFFAHPENVLLGMPGDDDDEIRRTPKMLLVKATLEYFKFSSSILMHSLFIKWSI